MVPIASPFPEESTGYLLVESTHLSFLAECGPLQLYTCIPANMTNLTGLMPMLVDMSTMSADQLKVVKQVLDSQAKGMHPPAICGILTSELSVEEVADHVAKFLYLLDVNGQPVFWRFYDPRVFSLIIILFSEKQRCILLGPIHEWRFIWRGYWWSVREENIDADWWLEVDQGVPTAEQWPTINLSRQLDQVLLRLEIEVNASEKDCLRFQKIAVRLLREASVNLMLQDADELIDYAYLGVKCGSRFLKNPKLIAALVGLANGSLRWFEFKKTLDVSSLTIDENLKS